MDLTGKKILVVEDEEFNWWLIRDTLEDTNAQFVWAKFGQQALDILAEDASINLVLMDMKMPILDGYETTRKLKEFWPELPVIAQTAFARNEEKDKCLEAGCDSYITKPLDFAELKDLLKEYLGKNK